MPGGRDIFVSEAVAAGKRAAACIDAYLQGFIFRKADPLRDIEPSQRGVDIPLKSTGNRDSPYLSYQFQKERGGKRYPQLPTEKL